MPSLWLFFYPLSCGVPFSTLWVALVITVSDLPQPPQFLTWGLLAFGGSAWVSFQLCYTTLLVLSSEWRYQVTGELGKVAEPAPPLSPACCYLYFNSHLEGKKEKSDKIDHISSYFVSQMNLKNTLDGSEFFFISSNINLTCSRLGKKKSSKPKQKENT